MVGAISLHLHNRLPIQLFAAAELHGNTERVTGHSASYDSADTHPVVHGGMVSRWVLGGKDPATDTPAPKKPAKKRTSKATKPAAKVGNPGHGDELWSKVRAYWKECRNFRVAAEKFGLSPNSVKTRARRENWNK